MRGRATRSARRKDVARLVEGESAEDPFGDVGIPLGVRARSCEVVCLEDQHAAPGRSARVEEGAAETHPPGSVERRPMGEMRGARGLPALARCGTVGSDHDEQGHAGHDSGLVIREETAR